MDRCDGWKAWLAGVTLPLGGGSRRDTSHLAVSILVQVLDVRSGEVVTTTTGLGDGKRTQRSVGGLAAR